MTPARFGSSRETIASIVSGYAEAFATLALQGINGWHIEDLVVLAVTSKALSVGHFPANRDFNREIGQLSGPFRRFTFA
jgi:hypothetical protein